MNDLPNRNLKAADRNYFGGGQIILFVISLFALCATFLLSSFELDLTDKIVFFATIIVFYLLFCATIFVRNKKAVIIADGIGKSAAFENYNTDVESRLFALEEANQFFGASLKPHDMFRLVASRVNELVPFAACLLFLADESANNLKIAFVEGKNAQFFKGLKYHKNLGLAGRTFVSQHLQQDENLALEKSLLPENALQTLTSAIAVPLFNKTKVFGVLELFADAQTKFSADSIDLLEAVGERIAPLFVNSMTFEQNVANALTDTLTGLPNERAFFLVSENQIAESVRFPHERPLTILTIDLKKFADLNRQFGHTTGDKILAFAGEILRQQLRGMDFLARSAGDEFIAVLPTATEKTAEEITERIERAFAAKSFEISSQEKIYITLNFGQSTFGNDGDTAQRLLAAALLKKQQAKNIEPKKVLWFPKEYAN